MTNKHSQYAVDLYVDEVIFPSLQFTARTVIRRTLDWVEQLHQDIFIPSERTRLAITELAQIGAEQLA